MQMDDPNNSHNPNNDGFEESTTSSSTITSARHLQTNRTEFVHPSHSHPKKEELVLTSFLDLLQIRADAGELLFAAKKEDMPEVKQAIWSGMRWGIAAGVTQFAFLRVVPNINMLRILEKGPPTRNIWPISLFFKRNNSTRHSYVYRKPRQSQQVFPTNNKNPLYPSVHTFRDGSTTWREGWLFKPFSLALDATVSLFGAIVVTVCAVDKEKLYQRVADLPLNKGLSPMSDLVCPDFLTQENRLPPECWKEHDDDDTIKALRTLLDNCRKRTMLEERIRRENFLPPDEPIPIPSPGVAHHFDTYTTIHQDHYHPTRNVAVENEPSSVSSTTWASEEDYNRLIDQDDDASIKYGDSHDEQL